jgi:predicted Rossmann fold nucleotide-binding protein DprA/Smf involved in DNA uptake
LDIRKAERNLQRAGMNPADVAIAKGHRRPSKAQAVASPLKNVANPAPKLPQPASPPQPQGLEGRIFALLAADALHVDAICKQTGERLGAVFAALTNLEMDDLVRQLPGKYYERVTKENQ